jgi:murein DD-endopeptidase MepM/ murein hydrolase activator NlpD
VALVRRRLLLPAVVALALVAVAAPAMVMARTAPPSASPAPTPVTPPPDPLGQQLQHALQQRAAVDAAKQALAGQVAAAHDQQSNLSALISSNRTVIDQTLHKLAEAEQRFSEASARQQAEQARVDEARRQEVKDRALLVQFLKQSYMNRDGFMAYILSAKDFSALLDRSAILAHLDSFGTQLVAKIQQDVAAADAAEKAAKADADTAKAAAVALAQQRDDLQKQVDQEQSLIDQLGAQATAAQQDIARVDKQDVALAQQIAAIRIQQLDQLILQAEQAAWDEANYYLQHHLLGLPPGAAVDPSHPAAVRFVWPVPGSEISQLFGPSPYDFEPPFGAFPHFHTGIDLAAPMNTPVLAAGDGVVVAATASDVGYGNHIILAHDGHTLTLYGHLAMMGVKVGDTVKQGQPIGLLGSTGNSTGPHLHFEARVDQVPVDPGLFLPPLPPGASGPPALPKP